MVRAAARAGLHAAFACTHRAVLARQPSPRIRKALVSGYTGLGHMVIRSVLIRQIEELFPDCVVSIIAGNSFGTEQVFEGRPVLVLKQDSSPLEKLEFFLRLRRERFDAAFLTFDASPRFLIRGCLIAGIPIRVGHVIDDKAVPDYYYTTRVSVRRGGPRSEIDLNLDLLEAVYGKPFARGHRPMLDRPDDAGILDRYALSPNGYITVQIGAANGQPTPKRWLEGHFHELLQRLLDTYPDLRIVALGDCGDRPIVERVCGAIRSDRLVSVAGVVDVADTKRLISCSKFLICHDSGLLHLANALGTAVIALYGPSEPDVYAVQLPSCRILQEKCDCTPLGLLPSIESPDEAEAAARCPTPECMRRLTVDRVFQECEGLLDEPVRVGRKRRIGF